MGDSKPFAPRSSTWMLALGAGVGAVIAAIGILQAPSPRALPAHAVAMVNGTYILRADYDRALTALTEAITKNNAQVDSTDDLKQRTLDRLIEEELLIQRGLELGLPERDPQLRAQLSSRVLEMVAMAQDGEDAPDEKTLRAFYEAEPGRFRISGRFRVDVIFFAVPDGATSEQEAQVKQRALDAHTRLLKNEKFDAVRASGDPLLVVPPDAPLPVAKLQDYLGATATRAVIELEEGKTTEPVRSSDGYRILRLVERVEGETPVFEAVRKDVENAYRKQQEDVRLRRFLERRRNAAKILIAPLP
jgi:hypothetical protein